MLQLVQNPTKILQTILATAVKIFTVKLEPLKPYWKSEKVPHYSKRSINLFASVLKISLVIDRRLTGW